MQIEIPYIFKDIEDEGLLVFLSFFKQINKRYGYGEDYVFWANDVRTICGTAKDFETYMDEWPILHCYIRRGNLPDKWSFKYYNRGEVVMRLRRYGFEHSSVPLRKRHLVEIHEEHSKLVHAYLQGCLNNNLIKGEEEPDKTGIQSHFRQEFIYSELKR